MLQLQRQNEIMRLLEIHKEITVKELCSLLYYSPATIRRDLKDLEQKGLLKRSFGGAILSDIFTDQLPLEIRAAKNLAQKRRICAKAARHIQSGDTIFIAGSTTTFFLVPYLRDIPDITVITNSPHMSIKLSEANIKNLCTGGEMLANSTVFVGSEAERFVRSIRAAKMIYSARGFADDIISDSSKAERDLKITMLEQSRTKIFLCDQSKLGLQFPFCITTGAETDVIIDET